MTPDPIGTPLARTLGLQPGMRVWFHDMPADVREAIDPEGLNLEEQASPSAGLHCAHLFVGDRAALDRQLAALRGLLQQGGFLWVSWRRDEAALDDRSVREAAQSLGFASQPPVDLDARWAGIRLSVIDKGQPG